MVNLEITDEQREQNKQDFLNILIPVVERREGANAALLQERLINSDFFEAPASTKYHGAVKGGLCYHCLCVYYHMWNLVMSLGMQDVIDRESVVIVSLLHDFSKRNYYEETFKNVKTYSDAGSKTDPSNGKRFDWISVPGYKIKDVEERFVFGNHEETAEFMVRQFIPLTYEESAAILNHHFGMGYDSTKADVTTIADAYPLLTLLHIADMLACYISKM